VMMSNI